VADFAAEEPGTLSRGCRIDVLRQVLCVARVTLGVGLRAIYGRDPDGNVIELQEVLDAASPTAYPRSFSFG